MRYNRIEKEKLKKAETEQLLDLWIESTTVDEFKLKVATAGLRVGAKDRFAFWSYRSKVEHPFWYWTAFAMIVLFLVGIEVIIAVLLNSPFAVVPGTIVIIGLLCIFGDKLNGLHQQIDTAENGPQFYL